MISRPQVCAAGMLDKPLAGYWLLLAWPALVLRRDGWHGLARGLSIGVAAALACAGLGVVLGQVVYAPKGPQLGWLWALNNLQRSLPGKCAQLVLHCN